MLGDWLRVGGYAVLVAFIYSIVWTIGNKLLGVADASKAPMDTNIVTYGQHALDWWLLAVGFSLLIMLLFAAWRENKVTQYR